MFLGRSTPQWLALISALAGTTQVIVLVAAPQFDPVQVGIVIGGITTGLGAVIAFLANTATTPISDPRLPAGTTVEVITPSGEPNKTVTV